ncbi:MAG: hypothetical protein U9N78_08360 [Actinomycetota bacterium]|nr:hypothetical protein [Actinomycetota bacterium]
MQTNRLLAVLAAIIVVALAATGCSDSSGETTTADSAADDSGVVFGRGSVPDTVPDSFPIPEEAVIGATLVDGNRGLTEMIITFPATVDAVVTYYEDNLPLSGYEITRSEGTDGDWEIEFNGEGVDGEIRITAGGSGVSAGTVRLTDL